MARLICIPMPDYVECVKCRAWINRQNDGPMLHAASRHPESDTTLLYRPAPDRWVGADDEKACS